jgi:hypothetical protein
LIAAAGIAGLALGASAAIAFGWVNRRSRNTA